jgi:hypothetical protein
VAELIQGGGETLLWAVHKPINSIRNKEKMPESIIVPHNKKGGISDCNNYRGISLLST